MMKPIRGVFAAVLAVALLLPCGCLGGTKSDEYESSISYARRAADAARLTENGETVSLNNALLRLTSSEIGDTAISSLQTGESPIGSGFRVALTRADGTVSYLDGGSVSGSRESYRATLVQRANLRIPSADGSGEVLKNFDLTSAAGRRAVLKLSNSVSTETTSDGVCFTAKSATRAQFGARDLNLSLPDADRYLLSVTFRCDGATGLECYFSTDRVSLTEATRIATFVPTDSEDGEFTTAVISIDHESWSGTLQTLLFRLVGEIGAKIEVREISLIAQTDERISDAGSVTWTAYRDRLYAKVSVDSAEGAVGSSLSWTVRSSVCSDRIEGDGFIAIRLIDGTVFGLICPSDGGAVSLTNGDGTVTLSVESDRSDLFGARIYLEYTDSFDGIAAAAKEERNPLTADVFDVSGAEFGGYDPLCGEYRFDKSSDSVRITVKTSDRAVYLHFGDGEWDLSDRNGSALPIFADSLFPCLADRGDVTLLLSAATGGIEPEIPAFFTQGDWVQTDRTVTRHRGVSSTVTAYFDSESNGISAVVSATRVEGNSTVLYRIEYSFRQDRTFADLESGLNLFAFSPPHGFDSYTYFGSEGTAVSASAGDDGTVYPGAMPYLVLRGEVESSAWLIAECSLSSRGTENPVLFSLRYEEAYGTETNRFVLACDRGETEFLRGDRLTLTLLCDESKVSSEEWTEIREKGNFRSVQTVDSNTSSVTAVGVGDTVAVVWGGFSDYSRCPIRLAETGETPYYRVISEADGTFAFAVAVKSGTNLILAEK